MRVEKRKRILILTADAGFGHRSAAIAVEAALKMKYENQAHIDIVNPLNDKRTPFLLRESQSDYDKIVRNAPELYKFGYDVSDATVASVMMETVLTIMFWEIMRDLLRKYRPDAIFSTYPMYQAPLTAIFSVFRTFVPLLTAITDLATVHRLWFNAHVDKLLVPNELVSDLGVSYGVPQKNIRITGIPVHPAIAQEKRSKDEVRATLGWRTDLKTILAVGSRRVNDLMEILNVVNHFGAPLQLAVVTGKDADMYTDLQNMVWHIPIHLYNFVTNIPEMMRAADLIISKAGGLIVTESLASGLPMMLIDVIPGQEEGNQEYVVSHKAGIYAGSPMDALVALAHLFDDDCTLLNECSQNARGLGRPHAAVEAADLIWAAAQQGLIHKETSRRMPLVDLLSKYHIPWRDEDLLTDKDAK